MEFGHSEGTFTLKKFLVYLFKMPSELRNSQPGARESRFVVLVDFTCKKDENDGIWPFWGHFYTKKDFSLFSQSAFRIAKFSSWSPWEPFCLLPRLALVQTSQCDNPQIFFFGHSLWTITPWKTNLTRQVWSGTSPYYTSIKQTFVDFKKVSKGIRYYRNEKHIKISAKFVDNQ